MEVSKCDALEARPSQSSRWRGEAHKHQHAVHKAVALGSGGWVVGDIIHVCYHPEAGIQTPVHFRVGRCQIPVNGLFD